MSPANPQFDHKPARVQGRLLLESICVQCGESKIVSAADETLEKWEDGHVCTQAQQPQSKGSRVHSKMS
jgi:hypothetical protein